MTADRSVRVELGRDPAALRTLVDLFAPICPTMWSVTPYWQCDLRCVYCCTDAQGPSAPLLALAEAEAETDRMLDTIPVDELLIFGAFSDAYPNAEAEHGLTRRILEQVIDHGQRFSIVTKGTTILRDLDLLRRAPTDTVVQISICSTDDAAVARLDPGAASATERFAVIDALADAGIRVELNALPYIPDVSDLDEMFARLPDGVTAVVSPLSFGDRDHRRLLGTTWTRERVWERYRAEYQRLGHLDHVSWVRPSLGSSENNPLFRLPRVEPAGV
jgi:DNA repair photolyase